MKKSIFIWILILLTGLFNGCTDYDYGEDNSAFLKQDLQDLVDTHWAKFAKHKRGLPGGYALQILSPVGDYFVSAGELKEITNETHFRAASTTKTFTAAAIMLLHQWEMLNINHLITGMTPDGTMSYLPDESEYNIPFANQITIKMLLQHRGGVFDITNQSIPDTVLQRYAGENYVDWVKERDPDHTFSMAEMAGVVAENRLYQFEPNEAFQYSNTGYALLAHIVERVSGQKFEEFVQQNLLTPLGLKSTSFPYEGTDQLMPRPFVESYGYYKGEIVETWKKDNMSPHVGEGNVVTTPWDLANWMQSLYTGKAGIEFKYVKYLMMDCLPTFENHQNYGLGTVFTPGLGYGHNGGHRAFFTVARYDPETEITFVIYVNVWDYETFEFDPYTEVYDMYGLVLEAKEKIKEYKKW